MGRVDASDLARSLYASDASLYRVAPRVVAIPRHVDELEAVLAVCRGLGVALTMRGAGTSIAGNAVGPGVVVDASRHLHRILDLDPQAGTALVEPGVVLDDLQRAASAHGLRFGPDPSTHDRATIGGMIGNNACGSRALGYGRTSDNLLGLEVLTGTGLRLRLGAMHQPAGHQPAGHQPAGHQPAGHQPAGSASALDDLARVAHGGLGTIRTEFGRFSRQISGYALEHLLPENERGDTLGTARLLAGSEGTLAVTTAALLRLVPQPAVRILVALGYPTIAHAADAVPALLPHAPVACEGLDVRIVDRVRGAGRSVPPLPRGRGWLLVELAGDAEAELRARAARLIADAAALEASVVTEPARAAALWRIREDGAGLSSRTPAGDPAYPGWEDSAVPPQRLGSYLRDLDDLLVHYGLTGAPYGHFGDGCLHIRIDFPLAAPGSPVFREFLLDAARLAVAHGGSLSGEHGDGRARSELLPLMYSAEAIDLLAGVKAVFDPEDLLNPGVLVRPVPFDVDVRAAKAPPVSGDRLGFGYPHDGGDLSRAVHRCIGIGRCRAEPGTGGVMCPSYLATREEKDSTRGRARVLQDVVSGRLPGGWRSPALHEVLDLCLACKGCRSDCPTGVDVASYKAEALRQRYAWRLRPRSHYVLGQLPRWARMIGRTPGLARLANAALRSPRLRAALVWAAGVDQRRELPAFAPTSFRRWFARRPATSPAPRLAASPTPPPEPPPAASPGPHPAASPGPPAGTPPGPPPGGPTGDVLLFVDTFTDAFTPRVGRAAVAVLEAAGYRVRLTPRPVCCGLTWISTGQLGAARRRLAATVRALAASVREGAIVVGLEPSCTAVLRSDAVELLDGSDLEAATAVAAATRTLAEVLTATPGWSPPDLADVTAVVQPHCHHHAVMGWETDARLLAAAGATVMRLGGCCGLAGNFGMERGHHDVSVAVAGLQLLPALAGAADSDLVLADGFSCRTQVASLTGRTSLHLAELLARPLAEPSALTRSIIQRR